MKSLVTVLGLAALLATTPNGNAQTCIPFLTDIENYVTGGITNREITLNMVSLATAKPAAPSPMHGQATYSESPTVGWPAEMTYVPARMIGLYLFPATLQATTTTFYSDNRWASNTSAFNPFSPLQTTARTVVIFLGDYPLGPIHYAKGDVVITDTAAFGNAQPPSFRASCQDGLMYGFIRQNQMVVINLNKSEPVIR